MSVLTRASTLLLFIVICDRYSRAELTADETEITLLLLDHFRGSFCIHALDNSTLESGPVRLFSRQGNYFLYLSTVNQLENYVLSTQTSQQLSGRSLIVLKSGQESLTSLRQISQRMSLSSAIWVVYGQDSLNKKDFEGVYIPFDCEFIYVNARDNLYLLTEIYRIRQTSDIETCNFGFWTKDKGLTIHEKQFYHRRKSLKGFTFSALAGDVPPYIILKEKTMDAPEFEGYFYEVWNEIQHRLNFRVKFSDKRSDIFASETEFTLIPIVYDSSTLDYMDITHPIYESRSYLFGHRPGSELKWDSYLKPFDAHTWWATLAWMVCSSAALALLYKISWSQDTSEKEAQYFIFTFSESFATVFRAICNQGSNVTPQSNSCRLLFLSIYLTAMVVSSAFSAALFSLLTVPTARAPFNNFGEVISNKAFKIGSVRDSSLHSILQEYTSKFPDSVQRQLFKKVESRYDTVMEGLSTLCENKMSIVMCELPLVLYAMQNMTRDCQEKVMPAGPILLRSFIGFGLKKGSPYKELIDLHVLKMRNEGVMQRLLLNNWPPQIPTVQATWVRVTLADISPILYMFGLGAIISIILLILEKVKAITWKKNPKKVKPSIAKVFSSFEPKIKLDADDMYYNTKTIGFQNYWH